jgi:hypothetical protein
MKVDDLLQAFRESQKNDRRRAIECIIGICAIAILLPRIYVLVQLMTTPEGRALVYDNMADYVDRTTSFYRIT